MINFILIILMAILPMQTIAASERNLTHVLGGAGSQRSEFVMKHIGEHASHVMHHHDGDDVNESTTHVDNSQKSYKHIADFEQGCSMNFLLLAVSTTSLPVIDRVAPALRPDAFSDRTTIPLLRPPRAFA